MLALAERLRRLPYCAPSYPAAAAEAAPTDLLAAVFPHAVASRSTATARYVGGPGDAQAPAGAFVSVWVEQDVPVTCVARFLVGAQGAPLGPAAVSGWDGATAAAPPSPALEVVLSAAPRGGAEGRRTVRLECGALAPGTAPQSGEGAP